ncbi:MAG: OmpA family protein, partial [Gammaproteobacteria bacterium]|nr:OmpA family protein [Gammaproteobacteria bacterium]
PQVRIRGYSDGIGSVESNRRVQLARANRVAQWLIDGGVSTAIIQTNPVGDVPGSDSIQPGMRRAEIKIGVVKSR